MSRRGDEARPVADAHARCDHCLRHDGDVAGLHTNRNPETGATVPRGTPGEQCTRGYSVMLGYWNNTDATGKAIDAARWMHTGDLATMDEHGYVSIVGRLKDKLI